MTTQIIPKPVVNQPLEVPLQQQPTDWPQVPHDVQPVHLAEPLASAPHPCHTLATKIGHNGHPRPDQDGGFYITNSLSVDTKPMLISINNRHQPR